MTEPHPPAEQPDEIPADAASVPPPLPPSGPSVPEPDPVADDSGPSVPEPDPDPEPDYSAPPVLDLEPVAEDSEPPVPDLELVEQEPTPDVPVRTEPLAPVTSSWPLPPTAPAAPPAPVLPPAPLPAADPRSEPSLSAPDEGTVASVDHEKPLAESGETAVPPVESEPAVPPVEAAGTAVPPADAEEIAVQPPLPPTAPVSVSEPSAEQPPALPPAVTDAVHPDEAELPAQDEPALEEAPATSRGLLVPVLAALLVVLLGLTGFLGWKAYDTAGAPAVEGSRTQALASARDAARAVFSYDYRHLDKDFTAGKAVTTGTFAEQYATTTAKLLDFAVKNKATVAADVSDASVVRASDDEVVCLVFLNQTSSSSAVETPRITQSRLEMTMKRRGSSWLVASINAL